MRINGLLVGWVLATAVTVSAQAAPLANGGFGSGDLSGWAASSGVAVVTGADDFSGGSPPFGQHYDAVDGDAYFAKLIAGETATTLSQAFDITEASILRGTAAFLAYEYLPYNDDAFVRLYRIEGADEVLVKELFASSVSDVLDGGHTDWTAFASQKLTLGSYVLRAQVRNHGEDGPVDLYYSSHLLLDGVTLSAAPVPEPAAWALMIAGFAGVGAALRLRSRDRATA